MIRFSAPVPTQVSFRTAKVGPVEVFYREAGDRKNPTILLLHGFPSSSHMFRTLIPLLADRYHIIAPDLPGFGFTKAPGRGEFAYSFDSLAQVIQDFTDVVKLDRYAIYVFDYGAPVGYRLAMARPERVTAIISQNGNAYEEGLSNGWAPIQAYWKDPTPENRAKVGQLLSFDATRWQYVEGVADPLQVAPESYVLDHALMQRPGNADIQLDLFLDYASNVALYPAFHAYFAQHQPPLLAAWGDKDPFFLPPGAKAYRRDLPEAEVHLLDTGHFALETHAHDIAALMRDFLGRKLG